MSKSIIFLVKLFLGNLYRQLAIFSGHTGVKAGSHYAANLLLPAMPSLLHFREIGDFPLLQLSAILQPLLTCLKEAFLNKLQMISVHCLINGRLRS